MPTYRCPVDADGNPCRKENAVAIAVSVWSVIHSDGTESLEDCWEEPIDLRHDPDPELAAINAGDAAYHERKEEGLL